MLAKLLPEVSMGLRLLRGNPSWHSWATMRGRLPLALNVALMVGVAVIPLVSGADFWRSIWQGDLPRAWDGSSHYAVVNLYDREMFPDTFGWATEFWEGMPFPNFYPPLFYWLISFIHDFSAFSFLASFKLVLALSLFALPICIWWLAYELSGGTGLPRQPPGF